MVRVDHQNDFKHEVILLLYEKPHELILSLYNTSGLTYYVVRIILNLVNQKRNIYHRVYNDFNVTYDTEIVETLKLSCEGITIVQRKRDEEREERLIEHINNNLDEKDKFPYYKRIVDAVEEHGGIRAASRATGIPKSSIAEAIKKVRQKLNFIYNGETVEGIY
jgi:hypothetical protein